MNQHARALQHHLEQLGQVLTESQQEALFDHLTLLQKWNKAYNLTAIEDPDEMFILHLQDSLAVAPYIQGERIIDIGTGAGFPGIPLAILFPEKQWTLLDSNGKKTRFLIQVKAQLGLHNVEVVQARCEAFQADPCHDIILTRAFSSLQNMLEKTQHLCCNDGSFLAMKGTFPEQEVQESKSSYPSIDIIQLNVPDLKAERHLAIIKKEP